MFINIHTIKGTARTYNLKKITGTLHEIEQYYAQLMISFLIGEAIFRGLREAVTTMRGLIAEARAEAKDLAG